MLLQLVYFTLQVILTKADNGQAVAHHQWSDSRNLKEFINIKPAIPMNMTYIDRAENLLRVPNMKIDQQRRKKKISKKSPKRTIQKIIKKRKSHKKMVLNQQTSAPTKAPITGDALDYYVKDEILQKNVNTTTQTKEKKKHKLTKSNRVSRYPMPFHNLHSMKEHRRNRRSDERDDLFVLTDFDEMEFLDNNNNADGENNTDIVNAHVQRHW
ncbi:hypothetical protein evm_002611 [Chilo suppressalis]|nr:hypothetical protein evm_002611 [Chilo suppressalis]